MENFDGGTLGNFDSTVTSSATLITYPHYSVLAREGLAPWSGDHVMRITPSGSDTEYIRETGGFDVIDASETWYFAIPILVMEDFTLTASDIVPLFQLKSGTTTTEVEFGIQNTAGQYQLYMGETGATNTYNITRDNKKWHYVEFTLGFSSGGADGTIDFYIDGNQVGAQIGSLTQAVITDGWLGVSTEGVTINSGAGSLLIDHLFMTSDARIFPRKRFGIKKYVVADETAFIGPCRVESVTFTSTVANDVCVLTDTDNSASTGRGSRDPEALIRVATANDVVPAFGPPMNFNRGVHLAFGGTGVFEAIVTLGETGSPVMSHDNYVEHGKRYNDRWAA